MAPICGQLDARTVCSLTWLITGLVLEQEARLPRIALVMDPSTTLASRQRRLMRLLDGTADARTCLRHLLKGLLAGWVRERAWVILDTSSIRGRIYFARVSLIHGGHGVPLAWKAYSGRSSTVAFAEYRGLLEEAEKLIPKSMPRTLLADRGFQHLALISWCDAHGWRYRIRAKSSLWVELEDGTRRRVGDFRRKRGTMRVLDTAFLASGTIGPVGLTLCWPVYGKDSTLHVLSPDPPTVRTLWEFKRLAAVEQGFKDDKSACFDIERARMTSPHRLYRLLLGIAVAQLILLSEGTRLMLAGTQATVDAHGSGGLSLLQLGARSVRASVWQGISPKVQIGLMPDSPRHAPGDEKRALRHFYHKLGLEPGRVWIPPKSYEERNLQWWLPDSRKRYPPRFPDDRPPIL